MALRMEDEACQQLLVREATDYAAVHGLLVTPRDVALLHGRSRRYATAPVALLPTPTPRKAFQVSSTLSHDEPMYLRQPDTPTSPWSARLRARPDTPTSS